MSLQHAIKLTVNGVEYEETAEARMSLADFLRESWT